jgi:WD40 repeat protein
MHTAPITSADVDAAGRHAVTGSDDKTARIWSVANGRLERTIRLPAGPGERRPGLRGRDQPGR